MVLDKVKTDRPSSPLTLVTLVALVVNTLGYAAEFMWLGFDREISIIVGLLTSVTLLVATRWRWTPILGALLAGGILLGNPFLAINLSLPITSGFFLAAVTQVISGLVVVVAGLGATVPNYRKRY